LVPDELKGRGGVGLHPRDHGSVALNWMAEHPLQALGSITAGSCHVGGGEGAIDTAIEGHVPRQAPLPWRLLLRLYLPLDNRHRHAVAPLAVEEASVVVELDWVVGALSTQRRECLPEVPLLLEALLDRSGVVAGQRPVPSGGCLWPRDGHDSFGAHQLATRTLLAAGTLLAPSALFSARPILSAGSILSLTLRIACMLLATMSSERWCRDAPLRIESNRPAALRR